MSDPQTIARPAPTLRLEIDVDAIARNWQTMAALAPTAATGAAVKANAYGTGVDKAVPALRDAGCRDFFVAHWGEAAGVIAHVPAQQVAVLHGPLNDEEAAYAQAIGARPIINSLRQAQLWRDAGGGPCDIMVDTGMNRLGVPMSQLGDETISQLDIDCLHSHLACADEDSPVNARQLNTWTGARGLIPHKRASLANSAGIALGQDYHGDLTRPGLALYGGVPRSELANTISQVARPQAAILQVRELMAGETIGYNATFTAPHAMRIGTVSLGYADGYLRSWSGKGAMWAGDIAIKVLGRVSMDMSAIDLSDAPDLKEGDWVEADYDLPTASQVSGLSQYELLTLLGTRFAR